MNYDEKDLELERGLDPQHKHLQTELDKERLTIDLHI
jgi:hypothetical protein